MERGNGDVIDVCRAAAETLLNANLYPVKDGCISSLAVPQLSRQWRDSRR
jgi:hypothetical protein